nr:quinolinate synthase NadA [uncultured Desulfobacter sp.]
MEDLLVAERVEQDFHNLSRDELTHFINDKKRELEGELCILEHNFQLDDLLQFADVVGDTSSLLKMTRQTQADYLVYCGARFFTEAGAILCPDKTVIQANMKADCPLTNDVDEQRTEDIYNALKKVCSNELVPMIYFTGSYKLKSFCGRNNGTCCTASSAHKLIEHLFEQKKSVFFTPMSNIALNVVKDFNLPEADYAVINEKTDLSSIGEKKMYIWDIGCYVHSDFSVEDVDRLREMHEGIKIVSHLECLPDVIAASDYGCFTDGVWDVFKENPDQEKWGLATVNNFAYRLAKAYPEKTVVPVRPDLCCHGMVVTDLPHLARCLQSIIDHKNGEGDLKTQIIIPEEYRIFAELSINNMYAILDEIDK